MAVIRNPDISDDEFDLIDPEPVSDMSDLESAAHGKTKLSPPNAPQRTVSSKSTRLSSVPSISNRAPRDTASQATAPVPRDATGTEDQQRTYASTFGTNKPNAADAGHSGEGIPGLKYTKSMYQKLWGSKDALIAVMG
ncbi:hypothetical protein PG985_007803 [Apiospora marii]|uniref:Uncharacterized protein n=1 Tax=Apiospora marii TaxID=335849 RepID=A0ABR1SQ16_9PEZI